MLGKPISVPRLSQSGGGSRPGLHSGRSFMKRRSFGTGPSLARKVRQGRGPPVAGALMYGTGIRVDCALAEGIPQATTPDLNAFPLSETRDVKLDSGLSRPGFQSGESRRPLFSETRDAKGSDGQELNLMEETVDSVYDEDRDLWISIDSLASDSLVSDWILPHAWTAPSKGSMEESPYVVANGAPMPKRGGERSDASQKKDTCVCSKCRSPMPRSPQRCRYGLGCRTHHYMSEGSRGHRTFEGCAGAKVLQSAQRRIPTRVWR